MQKPISLKNKGFSPNEPDKGLFSMGIFCDVFVAILSSDASGARVLRIFF
jgi:hypothetical protein